MQEITMTKEELIKEEIITTAQKLFQRYGFQKTTMEDIAKAMGRGKSTLYYYYKSKDVIFGDVILYEANEVITGVRNACQLEETAQKKLYAFIGILFDRIKKTASLYELIKKEIVESGSICIAQPNIYQSIKEFELKQRDLLKSILIFGVANHEFSERINENIDLIAQVINIGLQGFIVDFAYEVEQSAINVIDEEKMKAMIDVLIYGLK